MEGIERASEHDLLDAKALPELQAIASSMGVPDYQRLRKSDLIRLIIARARGVESVRPSLSATKIRRANAETGRAKAESADRKRAGSKAATKLIAKWEAERPEVVDLSSMSLRTLAPEVGKLTSLRELRLDGNQLTSLPSAVGELRNLEVLNLAHNSLRTIPAVIASLTKLQTLNLSGNPLTEIPAWLTELSHLQGLDLSQCRCSELPAELGQLRALKLLNVGHNRLAVLPPEIGELTNLRSLDLEGNQLATLPPELGRLPTNLGLRLQGNPLTEPLPELVERGMPAVLVYLRSLLDPGAPQYEAKVLLVGEGNVGKTSLIAALHGEPFVRDRPTTHGIEIGRLHLPHPKQPVELRLNTWDFGGQEVYRVTHQFFFSRRCLYLLVWRPREGQDENAIEAWCRRIRLRIGDDARVLIVASHADERREELDYPYLKRQFGHLLVGHWAVDNQSGSGVVSLRETIAKQAAQLPQMGEQISQRWTNARDELRARPEPQISYAEFAGVCGRHGLDQAQTATLAGLLHDLGHIIHYGDDDGLRDIVVLQPEWLTTAIGYVLEDRPTAVAGGVLDHRSLRHIWQDPARKLQYPASHHPYFLRLMEKFDVSYRIPDEDRSLVAQLVRYQQPALPWHADSPLPVGVRQLSLVCRMEEVAPGLVAWLTVRNHRFSTGRHWRRGVFLEHRGHAAQALLSLTDDRHLSLVVRAPSPDYFFSVLRDSLEDLIERRWKNLGYQLLVPCPEPGCGGEFELQTLQKYRERDIPAVRCPRCIEEQSVMRLLTGFAPPDVPLAQVLDAIHEQTKELKADHRQVATAHAAKVANQLRVLLRAVSVEVPDCPRLFTLVPQSGRWSMTAFQDRYRLTLWCEHPGQEHPWPHARYDFKRPKAWLVSIAPYLLAVSRVLGAAVPIAATALETVLPAKAFKHIDKDLELMKELAELAERLPESLTGNAGRPGLSAAELRTLLVELDPGMRFGGLRRVLAPSGDYLWVCPAAEHYRVYDPGIPTLP